MKTKRQSVFETNSSSMHSFTISDSAEYKTIPLNSNNEIEISFWEFWRGYEKYREPIDFADYIAVYLFSNASIPSDKIWEHIVDGYYVWDNEKILKFEKILKDQTWATAVKYETGSSRHPTWYIDHQSRDEAEEMCQDIRESIFRWESLVIDNDNH